MWWTIANSQPEAPRSVAPDGIEGMASGFVGEGRPGVGDFEFDGIGSGGGSRPERTAAGHRRDRAEHQVFDRPADQPPIGGDDEVRGDVEDRFDRLLLASRGQRLGDFVNEFSQGESPTRIVC